MFVRRDTVGLGCLLLVMGSGRCAGDPLAALPALTAGQTIEGLQDVLPFEARYGAGGDRVRITVDTTSTGAEPTFQFTSALRRAGEAVEYADVVALSRRTGVPLWSRSPSEGGAAEVRLEYRGAVIEGTIERAGRAAEPVRCALEEGVYSGVGLGMLLAQLPLTPSYAVKLPLLRRSTCTIAWIPVAVAGRETLVGVNGQRFDTWRVDAGPFGTYWTTPAAPYVIRRATAGGIVQELLSWEIR